MKKSSYYFVGRRMHFNNSGYMNEVKDRWFCAEDIDNMVTLPLVEDWINENIVGFWATLPCFNSKGVQAYLLYFELEEDAVLFKLRFL